MDRLLLKNIIEPKSLIIFIIMIVSLNFSVFYLPNYHYLFFIGILIVLLMLIIHPIKKLNYPILLICAILLFLYLIGISWVYYIKNQVFDSYYLQTLNKNFLYLLFPLVILNGERFSPLSIKNLSTAMLMLAMIGIFQFWWIYLLNIGQYEKIGLFVNRPGLAIFLVLTFFNILQTPLNNRVLQFATLFVISFTLTFLESRTAILAFLSSILLSFTLKNYFSKKQYFLIAIIAVYVILFSKLFFLNVDSIDGRILLWKISLSELSFKEFLVGNGPSYIYNKLGLLQLNYTLNHQLVNPNLLGEVRSIFNEYLRILVEYGLIGLMAFLGTVSWLLVKFFRSNKIWLFAGLSSLLIFSFFSYPFYFAPICLYCVTLLTIEIKNNDVISEFNLGSVYRRIISFSLIFISAIVLFYQVTIMYYSVRWHFFRKNMVVVYNEISFYSTYKELELFLSNDPGFLTDYSKNLIELSHFKDAIHLLKKAIKIQPTQDRFLYLAIAYEEERNFQLAEKAYLEAVNIIPKRFLPKYLLYDLYKKNNKTEMANSLAKEIVNYPVKIPSKEIELIKTELRNYLNQ